MTAGMDHNFPQHDFDPMTFVCTRCARAEYELSCSALPISCMSDADIEWTNKKVELAIRYLSFAASIRRDYISESK